MLTAGLGIWAAITIAVAGPVTSPEYLPVHVAQAEGYFAQEKLDVTLKVERSEGDAARALARGQADLTATSIDTAYGQGHVGGEPPLLLFGLTAAPPVAIVVSPSHRASIRSLADLRGQPVGLPGAGTPEHAMLTSVLSHAGIRIQQVPVHSYGLLRLAGALEQGQVAAAVLGDPWVTRLAGEGGGVLADLRTRAGARRWLGAETVHAAVFVRPDSKLSERELTAVARALLRAVARLSEGSPEALAAALPGSVKGSPEDFATRLQGARGSWLPRGRVTEEMLKVSVEQAARDGQAAAAPLVSPHPRGASPEGSGAVAQVACRQRAGRGGGHSPRNTLRRNPLPPLTWGHEMEVCGFRLSAEDTVPGRVPPAPPCSATL